MALLILYSRTLAERETSTSENTQRPVVQTIGLAVTFCKIISCLRNG